jgi:superfamily II DNA helicase RecQ
MYIKVVTLKYDEAIAGFPQSPIDAAASSGNLIEARDHFFLHGGIPHLALILIMDTASATARPGRSSEDDPSKDIPEHLQPLYRTLRRWRNEKAKAEGVPSYVLFRNMQLAEICRRLPRSKADLVQIEGIGESTCKKYGEELLALIPKDINFEQKNRDELKNKDDSRNSDEFKNKDETKNKDEQKNKGLL